MKMPKTILGFILILFIASPLSSAPYSEPMEHFHSDFGTNLSGFEGRAVVPSDYPNQKSFLELYTKDRFGEIHERAAYEKELAERSNNTLTKKVMEYFSDAIGPTSDFLGIIYAEGINNNPLMGGKGEIDHYDETAKAFAELFGSLPKDKQRNMAQKIKDLRDEFEAKENDDSLDGEEKDFYKLSLWAADVATNTLSGDPQVSNSGKESQKFRNAFKKAFEKKLARNKYEQDLIDKAANGDQEAKIELLKKNPVTLLIYAAQHNVSNPKKAAKLIRALGREKDNKIALFNLEEKKKYIISFGETDQAIGEMIEKWRDRYASGAFSLLPVLPEEQYKLTVPHKPVAEKAGDDDLKAAADKLGKTPIRLSSPRLSVGNTPSTGTGGGIQLGDFLKRQRALREQQQAIADRLRQQQQAKANNLRNFYNQVVQNRARAQNELNRQNRIAISPRVAQARLNPNVGNFLNRARVNYGLRMATLSRFRLADLLRNQRAAQSLLDGDNGVSAVSDPELYMENRCTKCHDKELLPTMIQNNPDALAEMPQDGTPMSEADQEALKDWASLL